jgi:hypothetical protein
MSISGRIRLFVLDTGPLITLAAAQSLDYLLYVEQATTVVIPDAVFYEATRDTGRLGAEDIFDWASANRDRIEFAPTLVYREYVAAREADPSLGRHRHLGEQAATEVINDPQRLRPGELAILLCEETAITRGRFSVDNPENLIVASTMDFLRALEAEHRIQSAEVVMQLAVEAGRVANQKTFIDPHEQRVRDMIQELVRNPNDDSSR